MKTKILYGLWSIFILLLATSYHFAFAVELKTLGIGSDSDCTWRNNSWFCWSYNTHSNAKEYAKQNAAEKFITECERQKGYPAVEFKNLRTKGKIRGCSTSWIPVGNKFGKQIQCTAVLYAECVLSAPQRQARQIPPVVTTNEVLVVPTESGDKKANYNPYDPDGIFSEIHGIR